MQCYAMQFIHGLGLDEVLTELKQMRQASGGRQPTDTALPSDARQPTGANKITKTSQSSPAV